MFKCKLDDSNTAYVSNKQFFKIKSLSKERGNEDIIRNIHNINVIS